MARSSLPRRASPSSGTVAQHNSRVEFVEGTDGLADDAALALRQSFGILVRQVHRPSLAVGDTERPVDWPADAVQPDLLAPDAPVASRRATDTCPGGIGRTCSNSVSISIAVFISCLGWRPGWPLMQTSPRDMCKGTLSVRWPPKILAREDGRLNSVSWGAVLEHRL